MNTQNLCVYIHTSPSNKKYVGITSQKPSKRWRKGGHGYRNQIFFWRAIQKYGWENFKHEIVAEHIDLESASQLEKELISKYSSNNPKFGYNIEGGGMVEKIVTEETRAKMSVKRKGVPTNRHTAHSEETKQKISESKKGKCVGSQNPMYGKTHSKETKAKISAANLGKHFGPKPPISEETRRKLSESHKGKPAPNKGKHYTQSAELTLKKAIAHMKPVICVDTGIIYRPSKDASTELCIDSSSITACCKHRRQSAGGFKWEYYSGH